MGRGMGGKRKSLLTWPAVETLFLYNLVRAAGGVQEVYSVQGGYLCQYFDRNLQGGEEGGMGLMHAEFGRCTH